MKRKIDLYIEDIKTAIRKIEEYTKEMSLENFIKDEKTLDAVIRNISIIGEAAKNIPKEIKSKHPEIAWNDIVGMRNKIIHEYFGIDEDVLWKTIKEDIPALKKEIKKLSK